VYRQAVAGMRGSSADADLVRVEASDGSVVGWGFVSPASQIAVRMVTFGAEAPEPAWLERRVRAAVELRARLPIPSDAMRLVNAEGDFLPGLIADRYADTIVLSIHLRALERMSARIASCFTGLFPGCRVYYKRDEHYARVEGLELPPGYLAGDGDGTAVIEESGLHMVVDFARGQKTGFYLDQRANRMACAALAAGRSVLNLFGYTGAFALHAARAGATQVVSVESSPRALELAARSLSLNPGLDPARFSWIKEDVFDWLGTAGSFGLVIADPPPFARRRTEVEGALRGYLSLNQGALRLLEPGGFLMTFSCSGAVGRDQFRDVLGEAALHSGRAVRFLRELHADVDHPVAGGHPEGEYLKGWLLHAQ
jgi:23S rRNA (cytosine1962-C5)-methyltransferase